MTMTEAEWLACDDPKPMLEFLPGKASERKLRVLAVACCWLVWHLLPDISRRLLETVERYAGEETGPSDLAALFVGYYPHQVSAAVLGGNQAAEAVYHLGQTWQRPGDLPEQVWYSSGRVARSAAEALAKSMPWRESRQREGPLLHDIFGPLPFRPVVADPAWLSWNDGVVVKLAQVAYEERLLPSGHLDSARLTVLADALEEAGCDNQEMLTHLRGSGPHVRGCWVVDLLLGKE